MYLLGKHRQALDVYDEARRIGHSTAKARGTAFDEESNLLHNEGLCFS
jgi:hypothetical protein